MYKSKRITQRRENKQRGRKNADAWDTRFVPFCPAMKLSFPTKETLALFRNAGQYWQESLSLSFFLSRRCLQPLRKEILILQRSTIVFAGGGNSWMLRRVSNFTLRCVFLEWDVHYPDFWMHDGVMRILVEIRRKTWKEHGNEFNDCELQWRDDRVLLFFCFFFILERGKVFYKLRKGIRRGREIKVKIKLIKEILIKWRIRWSGEVYICSI